MSINGKDILRKNNSDFVNLNVMYAYRKLCQASVCNIQVACYILALLETLIEIFFCLYRYGLNSRQFYKIEIALWPTCFYVGDIIRKLLLLFRPGFFQDLKK